MRNIAIATTSFFLLLTAGCKKPDLQANLHVTGNLRTAGDYITNNYAFSLFAYAVQKAGMLDSLNNVDLNYTLLLPDNTAFNTDSIFAPSDLDAWGTDSLRFFVRNHVLAGKTFVNDVPTNLDNLYTNLNGITLYFSISKFGGFYIDGVGTRQGQTDIALVNGVIHVLSYPLKISRGSVQDLLASRPDLHALVAGLKQFNIWDSLRTVNTVTVFAPTDSFFTAQNLTPSIIASLDTTKYKHVLFAGYTLMDHHLFLADAGGNLVPALLPLSDGYLFNMNTANGCQLLDPNRVVLGPLGPRLQPSLDRRITPYLDPNHTDYLCANGIVHLIGGVLVLPDDVLR